MNIEDERSKLKARYVITKGWPGSVVKKHLSLVVGEIDQGPVPQPEKGAFNEEVIAVYPLDRFAAAYNLVRKQVPMDSDQK